MAICKHRTTKPSLFSNTSQWGFRWWKQLSQEAIKLVLEKWRPSRSGKLGDFNYGTLKGSKVTFMPAIIVRFYVGKNRQNRNRFSLVEIRPILTGDLMELIKERPTHCFFSMWVFLLPSVLCRLGVIFYLLTAGEKVKKDTEILTRVWKINGGKGRGNDVVSLSNTQKHKTDEAINLVHSQ